MTAFSPGLSTSKTDGTPSQNNLDHLQMEWDSLYGQRGDLFHGREQLPKQQLANNTIKLCGKIILTIASRNGVNIPASANTHFGIKYTEVNDEKTV